MGPTLLGRFLKLSPCLFEICFTHVAYHLSPYLALGSGSNSETVHGFLSLFLSKFYHSGPILSKASTLATLFPAYFDAEILKADR